MLKVAIVILNWNGEKYLNQFLPSLIKNTKHDSCEVIIADNNSSDNSIDFLHKEYPNLRIIQLDKNYGFTGGYNRALKEIRAEYFVLLNSDIEVSPNWLLPLISIMDSDKSIAACQPKIKSYSEKEKFEYAGSSGGFIDKYGYPFCRGRILDTIEADTNQYNDVIDVFWASGACLMIRAEIYKSIGGLDDDFFAHMEEIDLCWRIKNLGLRIVVNPESEVFHVGGGTLPNNSPFKLYLNYRNNLFLLYKNLPNRKLFPILFTRMILDGISALLFLAKLSFPNFYAVLKAHFHFYTSLKTLRKKRKKLLLNKAVHHKEIYPQSIVFDYFIRKKRTFNLLNFKS
ncbi:MAG: glycosyltransferase family 2 protein [Bacteroidales bacterium]|nr:glycosyltransferase family 2 protein [Bacteroidales bacterium]